MPLFKHYLIINKLQNRPWPRPAGQSKRLWGYRVPPGELGQPSEISEAVERGIVEIRDGGH